MAKMQGFAISVGTLRGLFFINKYRFLSINQFAKIAGFSEYHSGEVLRKLEARGAVGYFGFVSIPGHGKTPKVYYLKRRGFEYLRNESDFEDEEIGSLIVAHQELTWTPQMYHRLRLLDLVIALEAQVRDLPHLSLVRTFIEYRRIKGTHQRETTDYVAEPFSSETRIVPDGAFVLENSQTGRRALFLVEMDMGTERIAALTSADRRAQCASSSSSMTATSQAGGLR
jgi:Replication-relaxation